MIYKLLTERVDSKCEEIFSVLEKRLDEFYVVGGFLRDTLHEIIHGEKIDSKDVDIITPMPKEELRKSISDIISDYTAWKSPIVRVNGTRVDVTAIEEYYSVHNNGFDPTVHNFLTTIDFDMNAISYNPLTKGILDYGSFNAVHKKVVSSSSLKYWTGENFLARIIRVLIYKEKLGYSVGDKLKEFIENSGVDEKMIEEHFSNKNVKKKRVKHIVSLWNDLFG